MSTGLTLGKYAPLHKGHQFLIERARAETDHLIVIIYNAPESTNVPLATRAGWIRKLYPDVEVLEAHDGPTVVGDTPEIQRMHEDYLRRILGTRRVTHFYSSEFYGDHVSKALNAKDCRVDPTREQVPISGTTIRGDPYRYRSFINPVVYRDLITKVVFLGAPSTGKTTLAESLARQFNTAWMPEYGREYWEEHQVDRRLSMDQLVEIAEGHLAREEQAILAANRLLFVDTDATTTFMFSLYYHGSADPRLAALADHALKRYDLFFLCGDDIPYDETWDRSGEVNRTLFQQQIRADLVQRGTPFAELAGSLATRMKAVESQIRRHAPVLF